MCRIRNRTIPFILQRMAVLMVGSTNIYVSNKRVNILSAWFFHYSAILCLNICIIVLICFVSGLFSAFCDDLMFVPFSALLAPAILFCMVFAVHGLTVQSLVVLYCIWDFMSSTGVSYLASLLVQSLSCLFWFSNCLIMSSSMFVCLSFDKLSNDRSLRSWSGVAGIAFTC